MSNDLTPRRALVTGAGHGIGAGIALALAEAGADVVVHYRSNSDEANEVVDQITAMGRKAHAISADVTVTEQVDELVEKAAQALGGLDIIVCNAGHMIARNEVATMSDEQYHAIIDVNIGATFRTVRAAIPHLRKSDNGRVITMSSLAAHNGGGPGSVVYSTAKAGIRGMTKGLAKELAPDNITVNALAPGFIGNTSFHDVFTAPEAQQNIINGIALKRPGKAEDVASAVVWLSSVGAGFITGTTTDIDGGAAFR